MDRDKRIVIVSHCILNQNAVVLPLARARGAYNQLIKILLKYNIGIIQLPCPEMAYLGIDRPPMSKSDYNTPGYRNLCKELLKPVFKQIKDYSQYQYQIIGVLGIEESPTCGVNHQGILMEELVQLLQFEALELEMLSVPTDYREEHNMEFALTLEKWLISK